MLEAFFIRPEKLKKKVENPFGNWAPFYFIRNNYASYAIWEGANQESLDDINRIDSTYILKHKFLISEVVRISSYPYPYVDEVKNLLIQTSFDAKDIGERIEVFN